MPTLIDSLSTVDTVDIDSNGVFKYILIKIHGPEKDGKEPSKLVVRGYADCPYHADIYDKISSNLPKDLDAECLGGGRINHDCNNKKILVYGYSQGFGRADHQITVDLLKEKYKDYHINFSDEGY